MIMIIQEDSPRSQPWDILRGLAPPSLLLHTVINSGKGSRYRIYMKLNCINSP